MPLLPPRIQAMKSRISICRSDRRLAHIQPASDGVPLPAEPPGEYNPQVAGHNAIARSRAMPQPAMRRYKHPLSIRLLAVACQPRFPASRWRNSPPVPCRPGRNQPEQAAAVFQEKPPGEDRTPAPASRQKSYPVSAQGGSATQVAHAPSDSVTPRYLVARLEAQMRSATVASHRVDPIGGTEHSASLGRG